MNNHPLTILYQLGLDLYIAVIKKADLLSTGTCKLIQSLQRTCLATHLKVQS